VGRPGGKAAGTTTAKGWPALDRGTAGERGETTLHYKKSRAATTTHNNTEGRKKRSGGRRMGGVYTDERRGKGEKAVKLCEQGEGGTAASVAKPPAAQNNPHQEERGQ